MNNASIPSHYQPVIKNDIEIFNQDNAVDIKTALYMLYTLNPPIKKFQGYIIPCDEIANEWGKIEFLKSFTLFPTVAPDHYGAIIEFKGKVFHVYYETNDNLIIGYGTTLYSFKNKEGVADCFDVYNFIFEGITEHLEDFDADKFDTVAKLYL